MSENENTSGGRESPTLEDSSTPSDNVTKVPTITTKLNENEEIETKVPTTTINTTTEESKVPTNTNKSCDTTNTTTTNNEDESNNTNNKDVEKFGGKIVYNPDGSAYIIEDGDLSEEEALPVPLPKQEGCIVEKQTDDNDSNASNQDKPAYPLIANAIYVQRSAAYYNALYGQAYAKILRDKMAVPEAPVVHSYKVYSLRQETPFETPEPPLIEYSTVPVKPILMCFVCKLSFGFPNSFVNHCTGEHNIMLTEKEKSILDTKNTSAIIQLVGKDKEPVLSFLEPVVKKVPSSNTSQNIPTASPLLPEKDQILSPNAIKGLLSAALTQQQKLPSPSIMEAGPSARPPLFLPPPSPGGAEGKAAANFLPPFLASAMAGSAGSLLENLTSAAMLRNSLENLTRKSPNVENNNGRSSVSPITSMAPSPLNIPGLGPPSMNDTLPGTTIGACPEHINGRPTGVECANCDMILNTSRMPGGVAWNAARNSCKTLKCPKCNWHYKYQETLEIHMKEKHPENDSTCIYCITGQQHPRLARGETYTCGYKPYRCEVCNYSTTTKGNLSIHTQSDKHLNNMQELQKGGVVTSPDGTKVSKGPGVFPGNPAALLNPLASLVKQKPNWRCDVCNYETNVARNLRIHMTSEKHTHNIMVLQQNVKHMQQMGAAAGGAAGGNPFPGLPGLDPQQLLQMQLAGGMPGMPGGPGNMDKPGQSEAAMADMAYLQALMMQMMTGGQFPPGPLPTEFNLGLPPGQGSPNPSHPNLDGGLNPEAMEPPPEPAEPNPTFLFNCCVCNDFNSDALESLSQHLTLDRTRSREDEVSVVIAGNSICKLCNYKTNLKANFQLHCKTDKHLQRLNHVNHIKEGGGSNEWKLKFLNIANPVQLRCNACDYYTNSLHKLQLHVSSQRHEISNILFNHLRKSELSLPEDRRAYTCILCKFSADGKLALMSHVRSMKHLQMEQLHQIQKRAEGNMEQTEIGDIFQVVEKSPPEEDASTGNLAAAEDSSSHQLASPSQGQQQRSSPKRPSSTATEDNNEPLKTTPCPLCQEPYSVYSELENHVMQIHSVNSEGLQRLLFLMEGSHWLNNNRRVESPATTNNNNLEENSENNEDQRSLKESSAGEAPSSTTGGGGCSESTPLGTISEKHVYKYRCAQCSLAFKTAEKLALHSQYHVIRDSTKCRFCSRSFRSVQALLKHVESSHNEVSQEELAHYKLGLMNHPLLMAGLSGQLLDSNTNDILRKDSSKDNSEESIENTENTTMDNTSDHEGSTSKKSLLSSTFSRGKAGDKNLNYPLEKYLDPNRPYKCDVCKESFTQKNILLVHYNSVSHLHRLKKTMQDQQKENSTPESKSPPAPRMTSLETALNNLANAKQIRDMDEGDKPYKCNICKVSYNQGSTLDIHVRSVLHQTRASKLQDLALSGQIDFSKPLIEQPDSKQLQEQHKKILQDMLSPKSSFNSSNSSNQSSNSPPPVSPQLLNLQQVLLNAKQQQQDNSSQHQIIPEPPQQQLLQFLQNISNNMNTSENSPSESPKPATASEEQMKNLQQTLAEQVGRKSSSTAVKNLLENYGFELVMQFNEYHQRRKRDEEERLRKEKESENHALNTAAAASAEKTAVAARELQRPESLPNNETNAEEHPNENIIQASLSENENIQASDNEEDKNNEENDQKRKIPEMMKSKCPACSKEFSSIWVLKAHSEEVHKDVVPPDFLEKYIEELKSNLDKSGSSDRSEETPESSPIKKPANNPTCSTFLTPEKSSEDERSTTFPETSTPKSRSSTPAGAVSESNDSKPTLPKELADFSSNFQKVMMNAQQQSQGINPMLLQMAQFQGMNPLVAMNLHPPLIPPSILQAAQQNSQGNSSNQNGGGIPSGMMKNDEAANQQMQLMMKLGIDPKILAQGGIDPKIFMQMSQLGANGPKMPDPNLLALFGNQQQQQQQQPQLENVPDPKLLFQMMQMGNSMPGQPDHKFLLQLAQLGKDGPMGMDKPGFPGLPGFDNRVGQPLPMGQKPVFPQPEQTKRARTRITDDQLKVLRSNFDINNSPTEEQIMTMAGQTGLPPKVIKHWFRNTLFKERQKNKDSPYNFNNPPSTMLNLEEYERTGEPKVIALKPEEQKQYTADQQQQNQNNLEEQQQAKNEAAAAIREDKHQELRVKNNEELLSKEFPALPTSANSASSVSSNNPMIPSSTETSSIVSSPSLTLSSILSSQMGSLPKPPGGFLPNPLVPNFPVPTSAGMAVGRLPEFLNPLANMMANEQPQRSPTPQGQPPSGGPGGHQGKRANRTRFTDYQIKVLQEFFENNAYPKDDDLEYLSKLLSLSPRVIVVWFQNARQKARKIYENQPPLDPNDDGAGRFTRTPGLNYQCKKCLLVFQRYYELIRHQKQHCFKEEDAKRSAQAQKAAAQAAAQFNNQQIGGPSSVPSQSSGFGLNTSHSDDSNSSTSHDRTIQSPMFNHNFGDKRRSIDENDWGSEPGFSLNRSAASSEEEKKITPSMFDQLAAREGPPPSVTGGPGPIGPTHQGLFPKLTGGMAGSTLFPSYPPSSPFGILQQQALQQSKNFGNDHGDSDDFDQFDTESVGSSPSSGTKRKHSEDVDLDDKDGDQPRDKRLRTTILPEQLDYLYQKYQIESNPSRKMLEQIANEVGLRKRVVQVWFQNTRARERKGQFRAHQQVINKRCPFCPAIFRVRSALESHLATKHADHYTRGEIDIDALPDAEGGFLDEGIGRVASKTPPSASAAASLPPLVPSASDQLHSMQKYYEDTMKRYMNDLQVSAGASAVGNSVVDQDLPQPGEPNNQPPPQATLVGQQS